MEQVEIEVRHAETDAVLATLVGHYPPRVITVRRLGWRRLEEAAKALQKVGAQAVKDFGGASVIKEIRALTEDGKAALDAAQRDPLSNYDLFTLLLAGVEACDGQAKTAEGIEGLEPEVAQGVARAILRLARPGLFETEADGKNA